MTPDETTLLQEYRQIRKHGIGKMTINIGLMGQDKTNILIEAGKTFRFILDRYEEIDD